MAKAARRPNLNGPRPRPRPGRFAAPRWAVLIAALAAGALGGCGYTVGNSFPADVKTVYVPIFGSEDLRRGVEFQLTEAVQKQIQQRTHFRLTKEGAADTKLTGKITRIRKNVLGESRNDDPRELQIQLAVDVTWEDLRTGRLLNQQQITIAPEITHLISTASFAPEVGQSLATATQQGVDQMARQIVDMMQVPW